MTIGLPKGMRMPDFRHGVGISIAVPNAYAFTPLPNMAPREIAYQKGRDAARRSRSDSENPYSPTQTELSAEWMRGYEDEGRAGPRQQPEGDAREQD